MIRHSFPVGRLACNCTILGCEESGEAFVIDPGDEPARISQVLAELSLRPKYLIHTHAHFDHVGATRALKEQHGGEILLHEGDRWLYEGLELQGLLFGARVAPPLPIDARLEEGDLLSAGGLSLRVLHTPGHTPGSCCFRLEAGDGALFSGDTLFAGSVGRTDLPGGDARTLRQSISAKLLRLEDETPVIPGHGPATTVGRERRHNPFLRGL